MNAPGLDPITKLYQAVKTSERMKGITVHFGPRASAAECSTPRIVMVPMGGPIQDPDHQGNEANVSVAVDCQCWGKDFTQLWEVIRRLVCAISDYGYMNDNPADTTADGVSNSVLPDPVEITFEEEEDTNRQGWFAMVTVNVVASLEFTELAADASIGTVDSVDVVPA